MWLLTQDVKDKIETAMREGFVLDMATMSTLSGVDRKETQHVGRTAVIPIEGVLTEKRDWMAEYFGGGNTLYPDIIAAIDAANADENVDDIEIAVSNSPGGNVDGLFSTMDVIRNSKKPIRAVVRNLAASATLGLVSQTGHITAVNRGTRLGSVGVAYDTMVYTGGGIEEVSVTNTESPDKRPDVTTDHGKGVVRGQLDEIYELFSEYIAAGRGTTVEDVNMNYGKGVVMLAESAKDVGMIDEIQQTASGGNNQEVRSMDLQTLKADHSAVYAEAVKAGVAQERDRVLAHLRLGTESGAMDTAIGAVESGDELTMKLQAEYQSAAMNKYAMQTRTDDNPDTSGIETETAGEDKTAKSVADVVCSGKEI